MQEIRAKTLLSRVPQPDQWFGLMYNMNLYRGCQHQCIYCDSRSECYGIDDFTNIQVKTNAIELLRRELASKRVKGTVGTGSMHDPYMPLEAKIGLTARALAVLAEFRFPVHVLTKSDLVLRDLDVLRRLARVHATVSFTVTTADDELAAKTEPGAPPPSARFRAMRELSSAGILTGVTMMPILPFVGDGPESIVEIVERAHEAGASYVVPWFGMSLRDRQREHYYAKLDEHFPGVRARYERRFGDQYYCTAVNARELDRAFTAACGQLGIATSVCRYEPMRVEQSSLF